MARTQREWEEEAAWERQRDCVGPRASATPEEQMQGVEGGVVNSGAFINFLLHNHSVIYKILNFFFRRSKRQRNFSLFYFAS